jgi:hypothetical protein
MYKVTHWNTWQCMMLADRLKGLIERPRLRADGTRPVKAGPECKYDYLHCLFFCLEWLNDGNFHRSREARAGRGKSSLQEDVIHVLMAIVEGLDDQLVWPDKTHRRELSNVFLEFVADVLELQMSRSTKSLNSRIP